MKNKLIIVLSLLFAALINAQIKIEKIDKIGLEKIINERNGKVLLLNIWATWCIPCREEFPDLVRIYREFAKDNVEVVGISIDFPEEVNQKVIPFLKKQKAGFVNYITGFKNDEELINIINKEWNGAIPATIIYSTDGKMVLFMEGKKTYKEFNEAIENQLK
ncbi:MAG: thiol-disulfide oxidoreductase [Ignavibacteria bacterium]|nr:MAG: thiol-disulfide oxidoreductase [Ignavibacteria bacterium]KAF0161534.1 MAG: thiol-disulfide oxidoreductase [Ignavibacteria bacterium]